MTVNVLHLCVCVHVCTIPLSFFLVQVKSGTQQLEISRLQSDFVSNIIKDDKGWTN